MTDLPALLTRLRAATGPDRALDADICVALGYVPEGAVTFVEIERSSVGPEYLFFELAGSEGPESHRLYCGTPALTGSIDAAVALMQRMLPGAMLDITIHKTAQAFVRIVDHDAGACWSAPNPAVAILVATVEALIAREGADD